MGIEIKNLCFAYKENDVLENINIKFERSKIHGILGLNGSGKTTLLKLILGLLDEKDGDIFINNQNKKQYKKDEIAKYIAYVPQSLSITYDIPVIDFVLMGYNPFLRLFEKPNKSQEMKARELLTQMKLHQLVRHPLSTLSGGELQMVLIARALIQNTEYIVMDEPVSSLDLKNQRYVLDKIRKIRDFFNKTIIISLHDPNLIRKYCDEAVLLKAGHVVSSRKAKDIINHNNLYNIYGLTFEEIKTSFGTYYV